MGKERKHVKPGMMFVKEKSPVSDVRTDAMTSSDSDNSSTATPEGPPSFKEQLSPPTAPLTLPDIMNLQIYKIPSKICPEDRTPTNIICLNKK